MSDLGDRLRRLRRLERRLLWQPSAEEYLDASNREHARARKAIAEKPQRLPSFVAQRIFTDWDQRILLNDTPEQRERDRQTIATWRKAQGLGPETQAESANEKWEAMLEVRAQQ